MYFGTSSTAKSSGSGIALFSGHSHEEDNSNGCGGHTCFTASGSGSHHQHPSRNHTSTSSANQTAIAKIAEDHVALFSSCMLSYENFIGGKLTDPKTIEEDFNQVDPYDMKDMDIQWNMAMILRRAKLSHPDRWRNHWGGTCRLFMSTRLTKLKYINRQIFISNIQTKPNPRKKHNCNT
ncbi:hypothetical protein L1987_20716 [Smallanthus sonchifolius]|uniref:Uncharacterized protein n=1 Tax=Smallanthus sonchifolius TaxID=185202 RepID=A0ACB9IVC1_9ASTR|nr:hypothetical protein L1987_20716 [Smallanthus sonchifolius]